MQYHRREKLFGYGRTIPLDREAKCRVMTLARALVRPTEKGKHYGALTAKALSVLAALLWGFHNCHTGRCFPSYETIAERAGCSRATVHTGIRMLERAGILTWVNRIRRIRERIGDGLVGWRDRVVRTSNAYQVRDPYTDTTHWKNNKLSLGSSQKIGLRSDAPPLLQPPLYKKDGRRPGNGGEGRAPD